MGGFILRKKQIAIITLFTIIITYLAIYFQWAEFYKGYSYHSFDLFVSIIFLSSWLLFSYYWGVIKEKKYKKFIIVYWGVNIITSIVIWILITNKITYAFLFPYEIWYRGPLYGFKYIFTHSKLFEPFLFLFYICNEGPLYGLRCILKIDASNLLLITSPLGLFVSFLGYWFGSLITRLKES